MHAYAIINSLEVQSISIIATYNSVNELPLNVISFNPSNYEIILVLTYHIILFLKNSGRKVRFPLPKLHAISFLACIADFIV